MPTTYLDLFTDVSVESIDLSKATKLRSVEFLCQLNPRWITVALRTIMHNHRALHLSISVPDALDYPGYTLAKNVGHSIGEAASLGWLELDRLLIQLYESHSIRPKILFREDEQNARGLMGRLLPEVMAGGIVELEKISRRA
jgi:hypothetical protein